MLAIDPATQPHAAFRLAFAGAPADPRAIARIGATWLGGAPTEELFSGITPLGSDRGVRLFRCGRLLLGHAHEPFVAAELAARTEALYGRILHVTRQHHLCRIWNYVPEINGYAGDLENYRAFCQGRSLAFEATLGGAFQPQLPAASAVGCAGDRLDVLFAAGETAPVHHENPEQVPAYLYPIEHGPRAPSFARATVVRDGDRTWTFISGTAAIKGHETVAAGAFDAQLDCTLDNLRLISRQSGLGDELGSGRVAQRHFKVYLRHAATFATARARLEETLFRASDVVTYLHADICRAALDIEIEATLLQ